MRVIAALGGGAFVLACLILGFRVLKLGIRTRGLPELCLGAGLFLMGGFAYPLTSVARQAQALSDETRTAFMIVAHVLMVSGILGFCAFTQQVFRPGNRAAAAFVVWMGVFLLGCLVWQGTNPGFEAGALRSEGLALPMITIAAAVANAWASTESFRYATQLKKRSSIGLASQAAPDRFLRWGVGCGCAAFISLHTTVLHGLGIDPAASVAGAMVIGPFGLVAAYSVWSAFAREPRAEAATSAGTPPPIGEAN